MQLRGLLYTFTLSASVFAQAPISTIYQFDNSFSGVGYVNIENVAVRSSNGNLLLNFVTGAIMAQINPLSSNPQPQVVVNISNAYPGAPGSLTGIVELWKDVFVVAAGNFTFGPNVPGGVAGVAGSFSVWTVDLNGKQAVAKKVIDIPQAGLLDGITKPTGVPHVVLIADSALGAIWRVDISTGKYEQVISSPLFLPSGNINFGINGIKTSGSYLYYTSSAQGIFGDVPFSPVGYPEGPVMVLANATNGTAFDDFSLANNGDAYIATQYNSVYKVAKGSSIPVLVAGGGADQTLKSPTSTVFGPDGRLYIVTAGQGGGPNGPPISGGVFAINI